MASSVREVEYYYALVADRPGEGRKLLEFLSEKKVNLLALTAFPAGGGQSQLDFFPADPEQLKQAAGDAGIDLVGPKKAFLIQGDDKVGALYDFHLKLSNASINIHASNGVVDGTGRFGYVIWVNPDPDESDVTTIAENKLKDIIGEGKIISIPKGEELASVVTTSRYGRELWKYLVGIALLFLIIEMLIARESGNGKSET